MSLIALTFAAMVQAADPNCAMPMWRPIYRRDTDGLPISGSKPLLLDAVRRGDALRIVWGASVQRANGEVVTFEHAADPVFVSIMEGEVVMQTQEHITQTSYHDAGTARLGPPTSLWRAMFSTNGTFDAVMVDRVTGEKTPLPQRAGITWLAFAPAPACDTRAPAVSLAVPDGVVLDDPS